MLKKQSFSIIRGCATVGIVSVIIFSLPRLLTLLMAVPKTYDLQSIPTKKIGIVFGAGITKDGRPTAVLKDRVMAAAELYKAGKIQYFLMSGDNRFEDYNEPLAMKTYAVELGIPEAHIFLDYAGRRTYDTCFRAKYIFGVNEAILITQQFHLPRAIFLAESFGINVAGFASDIRTYRKSTMLYWNIREMPAVFNAFIDVYLRKPLPILGEYEPILPNE